MSLIYRLRKILPGNRWGDRIFCLLDFSVRYGRLPGNRALFHDALYRIKATREALDPLRVFVSDKELVKLYVSAVAGEQFNVPTIAVLRSPDEVDRFEFPPACCIKPTHASGKFIFRRNGEPIDAAAIKSWFSLNHYRVCREANYKWLTPKVIVEPLLFQGGDVLDYRFFCVNGTAKLIVVDVDWTGDKRRLIFDSEWAAQPYTISHPPSTATLPKPSNFDEMRRIAEALASRFNFIRIDLYSDGKTCQVGEITNCHGGVTATFIPPEAEREASKLLFG